MKHSTMMLMSPEQLDDYARLLGFDVSGCVSKDEKVEEIESRRERVATIDVAGLSLTVPMKRLHDKRIMDKYKGGVKTNSRLEEFISDLLGEEQMQAVRDLCTDEDGTVDAEGYLMVLSAVNQSDELKNF